MKRPAECYARTIGRFPGTEIASVRSLFSFPPSLCSFDTVTVYLLCTLSFPLLFISDSRTDETPTAYRNIWYPCQPASRHILVLKKENHGSYWNVGAWHYTTLQTPIQLCTVSCVFLFFFRSRGSMFLRKHDVQVSYLWLVLVWCSLVFLCWMRSAAWLTGRMCWSEEIRIECFSILTGFGFISSFPFIHLCWWWGGK